MRYDFAGKLVLVIGAGHGLGRAIALAFADRDAEVVALDVAEDALAETARQLGARGQARRLDVTERAAVQALVAGLQREHGPDILVNCAGGVRGQVGRPLEEITPADWHAVVDANLSGAFWCTQAVAPAMKARLCSMDARRARGPTCGVRSGSSGARWTRSSSSISWTTRASITSTPSSARS